VITSKQSPNQRQLRPVKETSAVRFLSKDAVAYAGRRSDNEAIVVYKIRARVSVALAAKGAATLTTALVYTPGSLLPNVAGQVKPAAVRTLDFSVGIGNDLLRASTINSGNRRVFKESQLALAQEQPKNLAQQSTIRGVLSANVQTAQSNNSNPNSTSANVRRVRQRATSTTTIPRQLLNSVPISAPPDITAGSYSTDGTIRSRQALRDDDNRRPTQGSSSQGTFFPTVEVKRTAKNVARPIVTVNLELPIELATSGATVYLVPGDFAEEGRQFDPTSSPPNSVTVKLPPPDSSNTVLGAELVPLDVAPIASRNNGLNTDRAIVQLSNPNNFPVTAVTSVVGIDSVTGNFVKKDSKSVDVSFKSSSTLECSTAELKSAHLLVATIACSTSASSTITPIKFEKADQRLSTQPAVGPSSAPRLLAYYDSGTKSIELQVVSTGRFDFADLEVRRRVRALNGAPQTGFTRLKATTASGASSTSNTNNQLSDNALRHDMIYEYALFELSSNVPASRSTFVLYRDPQQFGAEVGALTVERISAGNNPEFVVGVDFSKTRLEQTLTALRNSTDGEIQTSSGNVQIGNYIDNIKNNREKLTDLFRVNIVRQDITTGREFDLGTFEAGNISINAQLLQARGVEAPNGSSRYVFRLLQRNAITLFAEIEDQITDEATLQQFRRKTAKWLNPLNVVSGIIPSSLRAKQKNPLRSSNFFPEGDFVSGYTGINRSITIQTSPSESSSSLSVSATRQFGYVSVSLSGGVSEDAVFARVHVDFAGQRIPVALVTVPHLSAGVTIRDIVTSGVKGPRRYGVTIYDSSLNVLSSAESEFSNL
jgi:hypothetical protein